jgi:hypothetical protein
VSRALTAGDVGLKLWVHEEVFESVRHTARVPQLCIAQDDAADELLSRDPLALLLGMLLDQHMRQRSS